MNYARLLPLCCVGLAILLVGYFGTCRAAELEEFERDAIRKNAAQSYERFWQQIARDEPYPTMGIRKIFSYALALCEARHAPERLGRLFELARQDQDRDPDLLQIGLDIENADPL